MSKILRVALALILSILVPSLGFAQGVTVQQLPPAPSPLAGSTVFWAGAGSPGHTYNATLDQINLYTTGKLNTWSQRQVFAPSTGSASSINLPPGTAPTSPQTGDIWCTTSGCFIRTSTATVNIGGLSSTGTITPGDHACWSSSTVLNDCGGSGGGVTSVNASGGTTGLTFSGGPITTSGTLTLAGTLGATNGGTGQTAYATGDIIYASGTNTLARRAVATNGQVLTLSGGLPAWISAVNSFGGLTGNLQIDSTIAISGPTVQAVLRSYLAGCGLSTPGSSTAFTVAACEATSSDQALTMVSAGLSKALSSWTVGASGGCLDTGSAASGTWYSIFVMERADTGVVDYACSTSPTAPTTGGNIPSAYIKFRRIGSMKTNGSTQWTQFTQVGDDFWWTAPVQDYNFTANLTSTPTLFTISVPSGVTVRALFNLSGSGGSSQMYVTAYSPQTTAVSPASTGATLGYIAGSFAGIAQATAQTNTSSQIGLFANSTMTAGVQTLGWTDRRGRDN